VKQVLHLPPDLEQCLHWEQSVQCRHFSAYGMQGPTDLRAVTATPAMRADAVSKESPSAVFMVASLKE